MNIPKTLTAIAALALALAFHAPTARADEQNELSYLTFNQSFRVPTPSGHALVLPAGTYEFRLASTQSGQNVVQVYNADQTHLYVTVPTVSTEYVATTNSDLTDHTVLTFAEGSAGQPLTLVKWYYADHNIGHEFVYSGPMERQLSEEQPITVVAQTVSQAPNGTQIASSSR